MDKLQKVASEVLDRIRGLRGDDEGWKTAKQTVCINLTFNDLMKTAE